MQDVEEPLLDFDVMCFILKKECFDAEKPLDFYFYLFFFFFWSKKVWFEKSFSGVFPILKSELVFGEIYCTNTCYVWTGIARISINSVGRIQ